LGGAGLLMGRGGYPTLGLQQHTLLRESRRPQQLNYFGVLKVIGDKKGGKATKFFSRMEEVTNEILDEINLPVKLIHMVRNPYDNIATMILRSMKIHTQDAIVSKKQVRVWWLLMNLYGEA
jgi:hypothetical protein